MDSVRLAAFGLVATLLGASAAAAAPQLKILHSFKGPPDGQGPSGTMAAMNGKLWGVTYYGGDATACNPYGCGTVFSVTPAGRESVVHQFVSATDGGSPYAGLLSFHGKLYGTTTIGGPGGKGTVFSITPDGQFTMLHAFGSTGDGANPYGTLVALNGVLYGTTSGGGGDGIGTVYQITPDGTESVVYSFRAAANDPNTPIAGLINVGGVLYGVAQGGGAYGWGVVYKVSLSGGDSFVYSFTDVADGYDPIGGLIQSGNFVYGTTEGGGLCELGCGTAFRLNLTSGVKTTLHSFTGGADGGLPQTALFATGKDFYSLTTIGGDNICAGGERNCGTLIKITGPGGWRLVHDFSASKTDGNTPGGGLTSLNGGVYGTTYYGGLHDLGVVYSVLRH